MQRRPNSSDILDVLHRNNIGNGVCYIQWIFWCWYKNALLVHKIVPFSGTHYCCMQYLAFVFWGEPGPGAKTHPSYLPFSEVKSATTHSTPTEHMCLPDVEARGECEHILQLVLNYIAKFQKYTWIASCWKQTNVFALILTLRKWVKWLYRPIVTRPWPNLLAKFWAK